MSSGTPSNGKLVPRQVDRALRHADARCGNSMAGAHVSMERVLLLAMQRTQHNSMLLLTTIGKADGEYILLYVTSPCARIYVHSGTQWRCGPPPQRKNHVRRNVSAGVFDLGTRKAYARKYDLPQPDETRMSEIESFICHVSMLEKTGMFFKRTLFPRPKTARNWRTNLSNY